MLNYSHENVKGIPVVGSYLFPMRDYVYREKTDHIVIHCSATWPSSKWDFEDLREYHVKDLGWYDVGYHFGIERNGVIARGRPPLAVAAGEFREGMNRRALHICMMGGLAEDKKTPENNFTEAQWKALRVLVEHAMHAYGVPPENVIGHRDIKGVKKDCPSFDVQEWMDSWLPRGGA